MNAPFDAVAVAAGGGVGVSHLPVVHVRTDAGVTGSLRVDHWLQPPQVEEEEVLDLALPPVLDVGCGPGRHTISLARRGLLAVGVDIGPAMVALARRRGAEAILGSIFDPLPGSGSWGSALLLDGNIGIGGDPVALLRRVHSLLRPGGRLLVEAAALGEPTRTERVRLDGPFGLGEWFEWAVVGPDAVVDLASGTGFEVASRWERRGRWFARLDAK